MSLAAITAANAAWKPSYDEPVVVITGGTSGIGQAMVEAFAKLTNGRAHIYIIARNQTAAERILSSLPQPDSQDIQWKRQFIGCDVSLMKNVKKACLQLCEELPKINFFVMCSGYIRLGEGRVDTEEGIDAMMAARYYSRWMFISNLMPLLRKARDAGEDARVMSVLAAGELKMTVNLDDLGMKKNYSGFKAGILTGAYNDYSLEEFSIREPGIAFTHIYPGAVYTPAWHNALAHWMWSPIRPIIKFLIRMFGTTPKDCAQYMWYALLKNKEGFFRCGSKGNIIGLKNYEVSETIRKAVWDHTVEVTDC